MPHLLINTDVADRAQFLQDVENDISMVKNLLMKGLLYSARTLYK